MLCKKNTTINLTNQLAEAQRELDFSTQILNNLQSQLNSLQSAAPQAENQLNSVLSRQAYLTTQLEIQNQTFNALGYLFDQYSESEGVTLNPNIVFTRTISAEELAHTDILKEACKANSHQGFDIALNKLTNLDFRDSEGKTILMHAVINGFYYGVDKLLQKGVNVNQQTQMGHTPLHLACNKVCLGAIKLLLDKGANINAADNQGKTPLHLLIERQNVENEAKMTCIKYLLLKSASTLITDNTGISPINSAINNFPEAVNLLEHSETLPNLQQLEASIIGLTQDFII